jgi:hypothetical protein
VALGDYQIRREDEATDEENSPEPALEVIWFRLDVFFFHNENQNTPKKAENKHPLAHDLVRDTTVDWAHSLK